MFVFLAVNQFGKLRDDHDMLLTVEGDDNVILIQTANYLLGWFTAKETGGCTLCFSHQSTDLDSKTS